MKLLNITPLFTPHDAADETSAHAEVLRDRAVRHCFRHFSDLGDLMGTEFRLRTSPVILNIRHRLKMGGIRATSVSALMVEFQTFGHRANQLPVQEQVDGLEPVIEAHLPVAVGSDRPLPNPTSGLRVNNNAINDRLNRISILLVQASEAVAANKAGILPALVTTLIPLRGVRREAATALAKASGNGIVPLHHKLLTWGATAGHGDTSPGHFLPSFYYERVRQ